MLKEFILVLTVSFSIIGIFLGLLFFVFIPQEQIIHERSINIFERENYKLMMAIDDCYQKKGLFRRVNNEFYCEYNDTN